MYGEGISRVGELLDLAVSIDIIKKSGAWFSYEGNRIAQGRDNAKQYLKDHPEIAQKIEQEVLAHKDQFNFAKSSKSSKGKSAKDGKAEATPVEDSVSEELAEAMTEGQTPASRVGDVSLDIVVDDE